MKDQGAVEGRLREIIAAPPAPPVVRLPATYPSGIAQLPTNIAFGDGAKARQVIRPLIEKIVMQPGSTRGARRRTVQRPGDVLRMPAFAEGTRAPNARQARFLRNGPVGS
ncbi:MAG: hypothetical protein PGN23_10940 [Sphingomonas adhaesiva]|uniref:hypothetical protein n=1 Tax=Sphingomonas adhaesiva TaxID=28212 RepID=UPI002FF66E20